MTAQKPREEDDAQATVVVYGTETCPYCTAARMLLKKKGVEFEDILVSGDTAKREEMQRLSGGRTVPQIFINDEPIGGFDDMYKLEQEGRLDALLGQTPAQDSDSGATQD